MPDQPLPADLQTVLLEALRAYELARATRLRAEGEARAARQAREEALQAEEARERQALEAERRAEQAVLRAEQERLGHLQAAADSVEAAARALLEKAGLAYIAGAPAPTTSKPTAQLRAEAACAFAEAQTAYADLRAALLTLAQAHLEAGRWEDARRAAQPLLEDARAPLYADARDLLAESYYRPALAALEAEEWETARKGFAEVLKINPAYRDAAALEREAYLRPARAALEAKRYDDARPPLEAWLKAHKDDAEARDLLAESHYRPALAAIQAQQWEQAGEALRALWQVNARYRDAATWAQRFPIVFWYAGMISVKVEIEAAYYTDATVSSVAFSPDGRLLAVATAYDVYGNSGVYNPETGHLRYKLKGEYEGEYAEGGVSATRIAFSKDGKYVVTEEGGYSVFWNAKTGKMTEYYDEEFWSKIDDPQISPDGRLKAVIKGKSIKIVDAITGLLLHTLKGHTKTVTCVAFSPDGRLLASGDSGGRVIIWGPASAGVATGGESDV